MEDSAYNSLMLGVYVFVFITAISLTIYLFSSTVSLSDNAFNYGKVTTGDSIIETTSAPKYNTVTGSELLTYYYNYISTDKYSTPVDVPYDFKNIQDIQINKTYTLIYESANTGVKPVITVVEVASEQSADLGTPIVVDKKPTDPIITTFPYISLKSLPNSRVEVRAESQATYSVLTNFIKSYYWRIDYSPEDGRADFTTTTLGQTSQLRNIDFGSNIEFRAGINTIYVTAQDNLGNYSNTISRIIEVGYNDPTISSLVESTNKVYDYGTIAMESPTGVALQFVANATSNNPGGYVQKFDWYVNDVLVQSGASQRLNKNFVPGAYTLALTVTDSIQGTATKGYSFTVLNIPAPTLSCSNSSVISTQKVTMTNSTTNLTFNASLAAKYGITKYVWNVDGTIYETAAADGINLNYGVGPHTVDVYGVNSEGIVSQVKSFGFTVENFDREYAYTGKYFTEPLQAGTYLLEVWGASGGNDANGVGGAGGYTKGEITIKNGQSLYMYVGGQGASNAAAASGGWNGGGDAAGSSGGGGGASDIRLVDTTAEYQTFYDINFGNGSLHDDPSAQHFHGPYAKLKRGTYQLDIYGTNLNNIGEVWACTDVGAIRYEIKDLVRTNTHISYYVIVPNDKDLMELNVLQYNPATKSTISITNISASRLEDKIIVAGGGGGAGYDFGNGSIGGDGGGIVGGLGKYSTTNSATQTSGGTSPVGSGYLGQGGNHTTDGGGGGGGYYGGGAGSSGPGGSYDNGGGGGSGYKFRVANSLMQTGVNNGNGKIKITYLTSATPNSNLVANFTLSNEYFNGSTSYSKPGEISNNFTITFDATPTTTTAMPTQGTYAYYSAGVKTYNYVITDIHGGSLPTAGMGISLGTNGVVMIAHSDNYYYTLLSYPEAITAKHNYKVVVNNKIPYLYIDDVLVKTGVTPVNCTSLITRPSVGVGGYGSYVGYANNINFYNVAM
jgi:hypothetical protein